MTRPAFAQSGFALFGLALGPIIATQLLQVVPSWRWVFWVVAIPGFIVDALLYVVLREPGQTQGGKLVGAAEVSGGKWGDVFKNRNIVLCMCGLFCAMACVFVLGARCRHGGEGVMCVSPPALWPVVPIQP